LQSGERRSRQRHSHTIQVDVRLDLTSTSGYVALAGRSQGNLCLSGAIDRFVRTGEVWSVGGDGRMHLQFDLDDLPQPTLSVTAVAGSTWHFQGWYRDMNPTATSNFTGSVGVTLQ